MNSFFFFLFLSQPRHLHYCQSIDLYGGYFYFPVEVRLHIATTNWKWSKCILNCCIWWMIVDLSCIEVLTCKSTMRLEKLTDVIILWLAWEDLILQNLFYFLLPRILTDFDSTKQEQVALSFVRCGVHHKITMQLGTELGIYVWGDRGKTIILICNSRKIQFTIYIRIFVHFFIISVILIRT